MGILGQLGQLFLAALPTSIIVVLFYFFLRWSFFTPIEKVLKERKARMAGARRETEALHAAAEEKKRARQDALRKARAQIFSEQEATRRIALDERAATVQQARARVSEEIQAARARIAAEMEATRGELEAVGNLLAEQIVHAILDRPEARELQ
jgi:F0F1-type ATP synthase membrane subunit b/b'